MTDPISLISHLPFHRRVTLTTPSYGPLTITYADIGTPTGPALLFCPGMFASRYLGIPHHVLAERAGVRLIVADRMGMGGSTDVKAEERVRVWVEIFPLLLEKLGVQKVGLACHSAGTMYLFNCWHKYPGLVSGRVFVLAPWIDPTHSKVTSMQAASYLPKGLFNYWHSIPRFFVTQASPVLASSGAVMRKMSGSMSSISGLSGSKNDSQEESDKSFLDANYKRIQRDYGVPVKESEEIARLCLKYMFDESTVGANGEALLCVRNTKNGGADWGVCEDYGECAKTLRGLEGEGKVELRAYFAEKDALTGSRGQRYFDECWKSSTPDAEEGVKYVGRWVQGTDHDTLASAVEVWEEILGLVSGDSQ
ncbi:alpha/beta fold hydrolase [Aspergillus stella-maris]|uniref:alpha/beta fold hydrolase n=1 Tax=Aspergillus stella-maris TaxID=1810926 RepID=UPI003CCDD761